MRGCPVCRTALSGFLLLSCSSQSQPSAAQNPLTGDNSEVSTSGEAEAGPIEPPREIPSDAAQAPCSEALSLAIRTLKHEGKAMDASYFTIAPSSEPFDFNGDGVADCVLSWPSQNYIFIRQPNQAEGYRYAGMVIADTEFGKVQIFCSTVNTQGLCNISGAQRMIHGETQTRNYEFDGERYQEVSVHLSEPHPKFGP